MTDDISELNLSHGRGEQDGDDDDDDDDGVFSFAGDDAAPDSETDVAPVEPDMMDEVLPGDVSESDNDKVEPVEPLVQLVKEGTINPWNIDIVEVTDMLLNRLDAVDPWTTGRVLFYVSALLRMKSDELLTPDEPDEEELGPWEPALENCGDEDHPGDDGEGPSGFDPIDALKSEMDRWLEHKRVRGSSETLNESVRELQEAERGSWWKRHREYDTSESPRGSPRGMQTLDYHTSGEMRGAGEPTEDDVTRTAYNEDIEAVVGAIGDVLVTHYERGHDEVLLAEIRDMADAVMTVYLALLFLSHRSMIYLRQGGLLSDPQIRNPEVFDADPGAGSDADAGAEVADYTDAEVVNGDDNTDDTDSDDPGLGAEAIVND